MPKKIFFISICLLIFPMLLAAPMTPYPEREYEGAYDYFILGKSLLADTGSYSDWEPNKGDTSLGVEGTAATLKKDDLPPDAKIEEAFLIWFASKNDSDKAAHCDNKVFLTLPDGSEHEVEASVLGNSLTETTLEFDSYYKSGYYYYVYRVDITDILTEYQMQEIESGIKPLDGEYSVRGVTDIWDCHDDPNHNYCKNASMTGGWQVLFVYSSSLIARKRLYLYHGLDWSSNTKLNPKPINVANFELPEAASVKVSFVTIDGDNEPDYSESLEMIGELAETNLVLGETGPDACNPLDQPFNSKYRTYNYKGEPSECIEELSFDIDTFFLEYSEDDAANVINPHIQYGTTWFNFFIKTGADIILTNYVMLSVDTKLPAFDIPEADEKFVYSHSENHGQVCEELPFVYEIRVENHGQEPAQNVVVTDPIPSGLKYVSGSTQIDKTGSGTCYESVEDVSGQSPIEKGMKVADTLSICQDESNCESILVRFKVEPVDAKKNSVYQNIAFIHDDISGKDASYKSNQGIPLLTTVDMTCPDEEEKDLYTAESTACGDEVAEDNGKEHTEDELDEEEKEPGDDEENLEPEESNNPEVEDESGCSCFFLSIDF